MTRSDENGESGGSKSSRKRWSLRRIATGLLVLVVILLAAGLIVVRTSFFRKKLAAGIEKRTGLAATMEGTRIGWPYDLVIEGLKTVPVREGSQAGITVGQLRIEPGICGERRVTLDRVALTLVRNKDGAWEPVPFEGFGELRKLEQVAPLTEGIRREMRLNIVRGRILWLDPEGRKLASLQDFDFSMESVTTSNGRRIYFCSLTAGEMIQEDGPEKRNISADWVFSEDNRSIEIAREEQDGLRSAGPGPRKPDRKKQR
jgi:hypothetical protein